MKHIFAFLFFVLIVNCGFSQDVIMLKNGSKVEAKVVEINSTSIKYYKFEQQDGPIRILEKHELSEIVYENGESEKFNVSAPVPEQSSQNESFTRPPRLPKPEKDPFFGNGPSLEGFLGMSQFNYTRYSNVYDNNIGQNVQIVNIQHLNYLTFGFNYHKRWYYGKRESWRLGIHMNWIRFGIHLEDANVDNFFVGARTISPFHFGLCGIYKFNEKMALDANINYGPTLSLDIANDFYVLGPTLTIESKLKMKKLAVGLSYQYSKLDDGVGDVNPRRIMIGNTLAISISKKF